MMKKLFYIPAVIGMLVLSSCADENLAPLAVFDTLQKGAYPRQVEVVNTEFDLANPSTSAVAYTVEFVDLEKGNLVDQYVINASFKDNSGGTNTKASTVYKTFSQSDFTTNADGFRQISITIPLSDLLTLFGLTINDVSSGDDFVIQTQLKLTDGSVFGSANSTDTVKGGAFRSLFDITAKATCPLASGKFVGDYKLELTTADVGGFGPIFGAAPPNVTLALVSGSSTKRSFKFTYLPDDYAFGPYTVTLEFACDKVFVSSINTGVGCGGGSITIVQGDVTGFNLADDSTIEFNLVEFDKDGGCGVPKVTHGVKLTKI